MGLGTYGRRGSLAEIAEVALAAGIRTYDSAPHYRDGSSLMEIGQAVRRARCPAVQVTTKVGFFADPLVAVARGLATVGDVVGNHVLTQASIRFQVEQSIQMLGRSPNLALIHNPERQRNGRSDREFRALMSGALYALEEARDSGHIDSYGVATWADLTDKSARPLSARWLLKVANSVGGASHGLEAIQIPINLVRIEAVRRKGDSNLIDEAWEAGLRVVASSPMHGGELPD